MKNSEENSYNNFIVKRGGNKKGKINTYDKPQKKVTIPASEV